MKNVVGHPARAEDFFPRKNEMAKLEKLLSTGSNIQIAAPRRIGKTSLLLYYYDNPPDNTYVVFVDTESVDSVNNYYKKLYEKILENEFIKNSASIKEQLQKAGNTFLGKLKGVTVGGFGVEFKDDNDHDYFQELTNFIKGIDLEGNRIILMVDEFPETIINILEANDGDSKNANLLLSTNRELRQDPIINERLQWIYTGSVSLNLTVDQFGSSRFINDLVAIGVGPLLEPEARSLIDAVLSQQGYTIETAQQDHFIQTMKWLIVSQVQMVIDEITTIIDPEMPITNEVIDSAVSNLLGNEHKNYFNHYVSRLAKVFKGDEYKLAKEILDSCASKSLITKNEMRDLAVKIEVLEKLNRVVDGLVYDGYLNDTGQSGNFVFNSPILKMWWLKHVYNG